MREEVSVIGREEKDEATDRVDERESRLLSNGCAVESGGKIVDFAKEARDQKEEKEGEEAHDSDLV